MGARHSKEADEARKICVPAVLKRLTGEITQEQLEAETAKIKIVRKEEPSPMKTIQKVFPGAEEVQRGCPKDK